MSSKELEFLHEVLPRCIWDKSYASDNIHVTLTFAQSLDGKIAGVGGKQLILSGKESMVMTHWMRSMHDAILVGINTVLNDNPQLNTRHLPPRNEPYAQPLPVILDPRLRILDFKDKCKLFANALAGTGRRPLIICARTSEEAERSLRSAADMHYVELGDDGRIQLHSLMQAIEIYQIRSLMVEGGQGVISSFLYHEPPIVQSVIITIAPCIVGSDGVGVTSGNSEARRLKHTKTEMLGEDIVVAYRIS